MSIQRIIQTTSVPTRLFGELDNREVTLWITDDLDNTDDLLALAALTDLPWYQVISEINYSEFIATLRQQEELSDPMVRRRGFKHVISTNPNDISLPPRALPIFLLDGPPEDRSTAFSARTRRQNMLTEVLRAPIRSLILVGLPLDQTQQDLNDLWDEGFRPTIYVVSRSEGAVKSLGALLEKPVPKTHSIIKLSTTAFSKSLADAYVVQRIGKQILRIRNAAGETIKLDITSLDDPERPLLGKFEMIPDSALHPLLPSDLSPDEIQDFFGNVRKSWRPFAAGIPFHADSHPINKVVRALQKMEREKADRLRVRFISAEDGAGATTLLRSICWEAAHKGFPVLIARDAPFEPKADEVSSYLNRINSLLAETSTSNALTVHEVPWVVAFDRGTWEGREDDLVTFARRLENLGRQVVIVVVIGPFLPIPFYSDRRFEKISDIAHIISNTDAEVLGNHLNNFLSRIGAQKTIEQWRAFHHKTTSHSDTSQSSFWVVLSFWLQGRFNFQETFDTWIYGQFRRNIEDVEVIKSILKMSALSTEQTVMPYAFLPPTTNFPVSEKLSDARSQAPALGIVALRNDHGNYWTILHRTVADALLRGFFYDTEFKQQYGYETTDNPTHLALQILTEISEDPRLAQSDLQDLAERFATHIFKIDPERGHGRFTTFWREVLSALEGMPDIFKKTNRVFLHHAAISRRRIASDVDIFPISNEERSELLQDAINNITTAISISTTDSSESDLNLYNSLARAYYDLASVEILLGKKNEEIHQIQRKAEDATFQAYRLNPNNPYVIETYAENLLVKGKNEPECAGRCALEVLALIYSTLERDESYKRRYSLTRLADRAFDLLISSSQDQRVADPSDPIDAIQIALQPLVTFDKRFEGMELVDYPAEIRKQVAKELASSVLKNNPQAVKLCYTLTCIDSSYDFNLQLSLLESLGDIEGIVTPQMLLEKAVLFYQNGRHFEGDKMFAELRRLWRISTHFVEVPQRLHWLIDPSTKKRRQIKARVKERGDFRSLASVEEFGGNMAVFRPHEFGDSTKVPGNIFSALVSFGHNGPFLRPLTAQ